MTRTPPRTPPTAPTPPGPTPSCPSPAPLRSQNSTQEASMHSHDYVERLTRQTPTPQGKSLTGRPVFNITVQGTYNRLCGIPHNRFGGRVGETGRERSRYRAPARPLHQTARPGQVVLLLPVRDLGHLLPLRRRLDGRLPGVRGAGRDADPPDLRQAERPPRPADPARRPGQLDDVQAGRPAARRPRGHPVPLPTAREQ